MASIGGLAQYLNMYQQNNPYQNSSYQSGLASLPPALLGGSTTSTDDGGASDSNTLLTSLGLPTYTFPTDSNGQPGDKLTIAGQADPGVTPYQSSISTVLGRVASVVANLQVLTSKATPDVASQTKTALASLNTEASTIASQAGLDWSSISKAGMTALMSGTTSTTVPRLLDYLA